MFLSANFYQLSLVVLSIQILAVNAAIADFAPRVKSFFSKSRIGLSKIVSKFNVSVPSFDSFYSSYSKNLKSVVSAFEDLARDLYKDVTLSISSSNFRRDSSLWKWIMAYRDYPCLKFNVTDFDSQIQHELFGQHIVSWSATELLKDYLNADKPKKPLIMSFQGPTGCGKTFFSRIIADNLFQGGLNNKFVHVYHGSLDFPHERNKEKYREKLQRDMFLFSGLCNGSLFIFDEVDKMVPGVLDVLIPFLNFYENSTNDIQKTIFIFISNSGGNEIEEIMYDAWFRGIPREDMALEDFSYLLKEIAYTEPGGLHHSEIVEKNFIDMYVPFLPLEREHVKQCIIKELKLQKNSINKEVIEKIADQFQYQPPEFEIFSVCGCKRVAYKVDLYGDAL